MDFNMRQLGASSSDGGGGATKMLLVVMCIIIVLGIAGYWYYVQHMTQRPMDSTVMDSMPSSPVMMNMPRNDNKHNKRKSELDLYITPKLQKFMRDASLLKKQLPYEEVICSRLLTRGAFGEVWIGTYQGTRVAVKKIIDTKRSDIAEVEAFADEIRLMATFHHPHIISFLGFAYNSNKIANICAVTEFMANGDLTCYLNEHLSLTWDAKLRIAVGIARALTYLHSACKIIHRDIKSTNVLISDTLEAKLSDFGISRKRSHELMTAGVGTAFWTAPEVVMGGNYSVSADIYSFGVTLSELDTHGPPYVAMNLPPMAILQRVTSSEALRPVFTRNCPKLVKELADRCMRADPAQRPNAAEIVALIEHWKGWNTNNGEETDRGGWRL